MKLILTGLMLASVLIPAFVIAETTNERLVGNIEHGEMKIVGCKGCHGDNGVSRQFAHPNLAGQKEGYLLWQLENFRSGKRKSHIMNHIAGSMTDQDIADIAAYYASLPACETLKE